MVFRVLIFEKEFCSEMFRGGGVDTFGPSAGGTFGSTFGPPAVDPFYYSRKPLRSTCRLDTPSLQCPDAEQFPLWSKDGPKSRENLSFAFHFARAAPAYLSSHKKVLRFVRENPKTQLGDGKRVFLFKSFAPTKGSFCQAQF